MALRQEELSPLDQVEGKCLHKFSLHRSYMTLFDTID